MFPWTHILEHQPSDPDYCQTVFCAHLWIFSPVFSPHPFPSSQYLECLSMRCFFGMILPSPPGMDLAGFKAIQHGLVTGLAMGSLSSSIRLGQPACSHCPLEDGCMAFNCCRHYFCTMRGGSQVQVNLQRTPVPRELQRVSEYYEPLASQSQPYIWGFPPTVQ